MILMDCSMPVMDGYTACKKIRQKIGDREIQAIFVIAVTADLT